MAGTMISPKQTDGFETAISAWSAAVDTLREITRLESRLERELLDVADGIATTIYLKDGDRRPLSGLDELDETPVGRIDYAGRRIEACQYAKWLSSEYSLDDLQHELEHLRKRVEAAIEEVGPTDDYRERLDAGWPAGWPVREEAVA